MPTTAQQTIAYASDFVERRGVQRHRSFKRGVASFNGGFTVFDCIVRNQSETGVKLAVGDALGLPSMFMLAVGEEPARRAEVCWRAPGEVGVVWR